MPAFQVKFGRKNESSANPKGDWDDTDSFLITTVTATTPEGAERKARNHWEPQPDWHPEFTLVSIDNLDDDPPF